MTPQTFEPALNPSDETIRLGTLTIRFLVTGANSNGSVGVFELFVPAGQRLPGPSHSHDHFEETIYGLEGVLTLTVEGTTIDLGPGETLCIPRGAIHRFDNNSDYAAKTLCVITPGALGPEYFRELAEAVRAAGGGAIDPATGLEIMRRHGLTPVQDPRR